MAIIRGEAVILRFWDGAAHIPFACVRSITFNLTAELIGKSTAGSGAWKESEVAAMGWNFNFEGIQYMDIADHYDIRDIVDLWLAMEPVAISCIISDGTNEMELNGMAIITQVSPTGSVNNVASVNVTGEGTGELVKDGPAPYGNYPANFEITDADVGVPIPGETTLTVSWDAAVPVPYEGYRIKIYDVLNDITTYQDEAGLTASVIVQDTSPNWELSIQSIYVDGVLESGFSPVLNYP